MFEYYVIDRSGNTMTVYAPSLESAGECFPTANIILKSDFSIRLVRFIPEV